MDRIGIDLGGTKIEGIVLKPDGSVSTRRRVPTPDGYEFTLSAIGSLIAELDAGRTLPVGIGTPGTPSRRTGLMKNCNSTWLNGRALQGDLEGMLGRSVALANDANCLALSEWTDGAARNANVVFAVILGTGVGGGLLIDGQLVEGAGGVGGEWGHIPLPNPGESELPGPECYCGRFGCMECWCSGPALCADHQRSSGERLEVPAIVAAADRHETEAVRSIDRWLDRVSRGLAVVANIVDPDVFVFGGGLSNIPSLYDELPQRMAHHVFSDELAAKIVPAMHGDASGVRGAARLG